MKKCPHCAEEIQDEASKCRYCHSFLGVKVTPAENQNSEITETELKTKSGSVIKLSIEEAREKYKRGEIRSHEMLFSPKTGRWYYPGAFPYFHEKNELDLEIGAVPHSLKSFRWMGLLIGGGIIVLILLLLGVGFFSSSSLEIVEWRTGSFSDTSNFNYENSVFGTVKNNSHLPTRKVKVICRVYWNDGTFQKEVSDMVDSLAPGDQADFSTTAFVQQDVTGRMAKVRSCKARESY